MKAITARVHAGLLGIALAAGAQAGAQAPTSPPAAKANATDTQQLAHELMLRAARFLAQAPHFPVTVASNYDAVQADGEKIEFGERRKVILNRPAFLSSFKFKQNSGGQRSGACGGAAWTSTSAWARLVRAFTRQT